MSQPTFSNMDTADSPELGRHVLRGGTAVRFRDARASDAAAVREAMASSSLDTLRHRFFAAVRGLSDGELRAALDLDPSIGRCVVGELDDAGRIRLVCGIRYIRIGEGAEAELAMTVHDRFQRQGLGRALLMLAGRLARRDGIEAFCAHVLPTNEAMLALLARIAPSASKSWEGDLVCLRFAISCLEKASS